jgi:hypothetical protein
MFNFYFLNFKYEELKVKKFFFLKKKWIIIIIIIKKNRVSLEKLR